MTSTWYGGYCETAVLKQRRLVGFEPAGLSGFPGSGLDRLSPLGEGSWRPEAGTLVSASAKTATSALGR